MIDPHFGPVSAREVREADLFWADLIGKPLRARRVPAFSEDFAEQAVPAPPSASPCDIAKASETLDRFALDSSALTAAHRATIKRIADCIRAIRGGARPIRDLDIVGFTDPSGGPAINAPLGLRRAEAVRDALGAELGAAIAATLTFRVASRGQSQQIPGGAEHNRRVEVSVPLSVVDLVVHASDTDTHEIASVLGAGGLEHFVCVKGTGDVVLAAAIAPDVPGAAGGRLTWEATGTTVTSPAVGGDARTARLPSATSGKLPVQVKLDGAVARQAVVWVVWSSIKLTAVRCPTTTRNPGSLSISAGIDHAFTIEPAAIITDADRPALNGPRTAAVPGAAMTHVISGNTLAGGAGSPLAASHKWDVSRQIRIRILNPKLYPPAQLSAVAGHLWAGQPVASTIPENYPATDTIGNDDTHDGDENDDPYTNGGVVTSTDDPTMSMADATGSNGDTFERHYHFREFLRLNLGTAWYRASDFSLWRFHGRFRRAGGVWTDDHSTFGVDNAGF